MVKLQIRTKLVHEKMKLKSNLKLDGSFFLFFVVTVYRLILDFSYWMVVSDSYRYMGFISDIKVQNVILSWAFFILFMLFLQKRIEVSKESISSLLLLSLSMMSFVPFSSMFCFGAFSIQFFVANCVFWFSLLFLSILALKFDFKALYSSRISDFSENIIKILTLILCFVVFYVSWKYTRFRINFSLTNVYELREEASYYQISTILSYLFSWSKSVGAILIYYYAKKKDWKWMFLCLITQVIGFGFDGSKTTLFFALAAIAIAIIPDALTINSNGLIACSLTGISFGTFVIYIVTNSIMPISLFVRRLLFVPALISSYYFDFFTTHVPDYYRQSIFKFSGFESPYEGLASMIGRLYYYSPTNANNGLISDAISNLGLVGLVIVPFFYVFIFKILDYLTEEMSSSFKIFLVVYLSVSLVNSFLSTVFFSHGLLLIIVILFLIKMSYNQNIGEK